MEVGWIFATSMKEILPREVKNPKIAMGNLGYNFGAHWFCLKWKILLTHEVADFMGDFWR